MWPTVQASQRLPVFAAHLMVVEGELQTEMGVTNVIARKVRDYTQAEDRITRLSMAKAKSPVHHITIEPPELARLKTLTLLAWPSTQMRVGR